ncbi:AraC family transcriptional regulator [Naumannella huperziae]
MDSTGALLTGPRAQRAFALRVCLSAGWRLRIDDGSALCLLVPVRGALEVRFDDGRTARAEPGEVLLLRGPDPYHAYDDAGAPLLAEIRADGGCYAPDGTLVRDLLALGVRTWGTDADGPTEFVTATYARSNEVGARLVEALPRCLVVAGHEFDWPIPELLHRELATTSAGQDVVVDRLLDLLLLGAVRAWSRGFPDAPAWAGAADDPVARGALAALHHNPAYPWTVESLARHGGVSRAVLARRFTDAVGEPPMGYLTGWRIRLAADLLIEREHTLERIAHEVGYASAFALSAAFKRVRGMSPRQFRALSDPRGRGATSAAGG